VGSTYEGIFFIQSAYPNTPFARSVAKNTITVKIVQWTVFTVVGSLTCQNLWAFQQVNHWHVLTLRFFVL